MGRLLVVRAPTRWRRVSLTVLAITAHLLLGVIVAILRTARVIVTVVAETAMNAEQALAARTGRPALSQTGIGALTAAFVTEFRTAYHQPTR
jgi:type IV secretory pathway TrbF-like protein